MLQITDLLKVWLRQLCKQDRCQLDPPCMQQASSEQLSTHRTPCTQPCVSPCPIAEVTQQRQAQTHQCSRLWRTTGDTLASL